MKPFFSVCMIVRNEEKVLTRCLDSIKDLVDEIIIVDTGSDDNTKNIALNYTDKVFDFDWVDDFSIARNYAASKATGEWILVLDADEFVDRESFINFIDNFKKEKHEANIYAIKILNFVGDSANHTAFNYHERLYRNDGDILYYRSIHEMLKHKKGNEKRAISNLQIYHSGYMKETIKDKNKSKRNLNLLESKTIKEPVDYYFLGNEYYSIGEYDKAIKYYQKGFQNKPGLNYDWVIKLLVKLVHCLHDAKRQKEALEIAEAGMETYPDIADFQFLKGKILFDQGKYDSSISIFKDILAKKNNLIADSSIDYLEFFPYKFLGHAYEQIGKFQLAVINYSKALSLNNNDDSLWVNLLYLLSKYSSSKEFLFFIKNNELFNKIQRNKKAKILLSVPNLEAQKAFIVTLDHSKLNQVEREAIDLKFDFLNQSFENIIKKLSGLTINQLTKLLSIGYFNLVDFFILILDSNDKDLRYCLEELKLNKDISNLIKFLIKNDNSRDLSSFEKNLLVLILKQSIIMKRSTLVQYLENKAKLVKTIDSYETKEIQKLKRDVQNQELSFEKIEDPKELKFKIENLINNGNLDEARRQLNRYKEIYQEDADYYSINGILNIIEGEYEKAEHELFNGLEIDENNIDILFNLAYLFEINHNYYRAFIFYKRVLLRTKDNELIKEVKSKIDYIKKHDKQISSSSKNVLMIAYAFPPLGGPGVQRTLKFAKYLKNYGYSPIILTVGDTLWEKNGTSYQNQLTEDIDIIRVNDYKTSNLNKDEIKQILNIYQDLLDEDLFKEYISNLKEDNRLLFIPEFQIAWANRVIRSIGDIINFDNVDLFYTSADPNVDNIIGYYLKKKFNKPWVADLRDSWTQNPYASYDKESFRYKMECNMEKALLTFADKVVTVTEIISKDYISRLNLKPSDVVTITNGYDEEDFENIITEQNKEDKKFKIIHNGLFYQKRSPITFLQALKNLISTNSIPRNEIKVYFTRKDSSFELVKQFGLEDVIEFTGYMPHKQSLQLSSKCDLLLLIVGQEDENKGIYPGKTFEYLRICKPILSLAPSNSLVEKIIQKYERGKNIPFENVKEIENYLVEMYSLWKSNNYPNIELNQIKIFERKYLTDKLSGVFDEVLENKIKNGIYDHKFYDKLYFSGGWNNTYFKHYSETHYYNIWLEALNKIKQINNPAIIDIGCGPGQFANLLFDNNFTNYRGIDFSSEAINIAKKVNFNFNNLFSVEDAFKSNIFESQYNIVVMFEVLEHIKEDLKLLNRIKKNSKVLLSVPSFDSESHVRWFNDEKEVIERYSESIDIISINTFQISKSNKIFLVYGTKK